MPAHMAPGHVGRATVEPSGEQKHDWLNVDSEEHEIVRGFILPGFNQPSNGRLGGPEIRRRRRLKTGSNEGTGKDRPVSRCGSWTANPRSATLLPFQSPSTGVKDGQGREQTGNTH